MSVESESHRFTSKFNMEATKQLLKVSRGVQGEFMNPSAVCQNTLCLKIFDRIVALSLEALTFYTIL